MKAKMSSLVTFRLGSLTATDSILILGGFLIGKGDALNDALADGKMSPAGDAAGDSTNRDMSQHPVSGKGIDHLPARC